VKKLDYKGGQSYEKTGFGIFMRRVIEFAG
jgi:hypothetical protein